MLYDGGHALGLCPPYFLPTLTLPSVLKLDVSAKRGLPAHGHWVFDTACPSNFAPKEREDSVSSNYVTYTRMTGICLQHPAVNLMRAVDSCSANLSQTF